MERKVGRKQYLSDKERNDEAVNVGKRIHNRKKAYQDSKRVNSRRQKFDHLIINGEKYRTVDHAHNKTGLSVKNIRDAIKKKKRKIITTKTIEYSFEVVPKKIEDI